MASYLEAYGAAEQHRARIISDYQDFVRSSWDAALLIGLILYGVFKNYPEEQRAKTFLGLLDAQELSSRLCDVGLHGFASLPGLPVHEVSGGLGA